MITFDIIYHRDCIGPTARPEPPRILDARQHLWRSEHPKPSKLKVYIFKGFDGSEKNTAYESVRSEEMATGLHLEKVSNGIIDLEPLAPGFSEWAIALCYDHYQLWVYNILH